MNIVGPSISAGLAALQALTPPSSTNATAAAPAAAHVLTGASRPVLSASAADALLGLTALAPGAPMAAARASDDYARAGIPAEKAAWLDSLGADSWVLRKPSALDDAAFEQQVLASLKRSGSFKFPGFADARENGTLRILRSSDMPELGYRSFQLVLYKDGTEFGGVGFGTLNNDRLMELRRGGTFAMTGSVRGNDYVATWPLAWDGNGAASGAPKAA